MPENGLRTDDGESTVKCSLDSVMSRESTVMPGKEVDGHQFWTCSDIAGRRAKRTSLTNREGWEFLNSSPKVGRGRLRLSTATAVGGRGFRGRCRLDCGANPPVSDPVRVSAAGTRLEAERPISRSRRIGWL